MMVMVLSIGIAMPPMVCAQSTDFSAMNQWLKMSAKPPPLPVGTKITMANWKQYEAYMPLGMIKMFQGVYGWKMPADVELDVGPSHEGGNLPASWREATEKYSSRQPENTAQRTLYAHQL
jgi:hypothetical protein